MKSYSPGDIVWRRGTVGVQREPFEHPVVIVAVNQCETLGGKPIYTCAPVTNNPQGVAGAVPFGEPSGSKKYANLSRLLISGHDTFLAPEDGGEALLGQLTPQEMGKMRETIGAVLVPGSSHLGKIVYSATPSHDGSRGKPHRPYAIIGEIGRGSGNYLAVPISSGRSNFGNGACIQDLEAAGLTRDDGEASHTRLAWTSVLDARTSSKEAGRLAEGDKKVLYDQFKEFKKMLIAGAISKEAIKTSEVDPEMVSGPSPSALFPTGISSRGASIHVIRQKPRLGGTGLG